MLYSRPMLAIYFIYSSVHMLLPNSWFTPTPAPCFPFGKHMVDFKMWVCFYFVKSYIILLDYTYKWYTIFIFPCQAYFTLYDFFQFIFYCYLPQYIFFFPTVQHEDPVTHTRIHHFFSLVILCGKYLDIVLSATQQDLIVKSLQEQ